jgi:Z1 domain
MSTDTGFESVLVRQLVVVVLDFRVKRGEATSPEELRGIVNTTAAQHMGDGKPSDEELEQLARDLEAEYNVQIGNANSLQDDTDHVPWLEDRLDTKAEWRFWTRYERYLRNEQGLSLAAVNSIDRETDNILGRLEDPAREGSWDRRGLVAGQVQSGKTGNYTGLIAKAIDNGYKLVVVLAGIHSSLRSQTQTRIDEGILGFDTRYSRLANQAGASAKIGVGRMAGLWLHANSFTSSAEDGDFRLAVAQNLGIQPGGNDPIVLVVKKNKAILDNLYEWATRLTTETDPATNQPKVRGIPILVIDDEADNASVNTKTSGADPSAINGLVRKFLNTFQQSAYVGYTATPFANIFIDPDADHDVSGEELFPRSFIINLPAPSNYIGPERFFGLDEDARNAIEAVDPIPISRKVADYTTWLPDSHKSGDHPQGDLPESLKDAITFFLLAGAVRRLRGQEQKHHSMLVHVTRFVGIQHEVADQIRDHLADVTRRLTYGEGSNPVVEEQARRLFKDLGETATALAKMPDLKEMGGEIPSFKAVWQEMAAATLKTTVHEVNGTAEDTLEYFGKPEGVSVIAVGGNKLSRGLTLEGLCVSYYLRASRMYDTLMQMGRWFGYRPGYLDLCRLYTTSTLLGWYERITAATAELQREFEAMVITGRTPRDYGLRVRQLPGGLMVSSPSKLRNARRLRISFSGDISESVTFKSIDRAANLGALERLVAKLGGTTEDLTGLRVWREVPASDVTEFFDYYRADRAAVRAQPAALNQYIRSQLTDGELVRWTIVLADSSSSTANSWKVADLTTRMTKRTHHQVQQGSGRYTVRRLVSPGHELIELPQGTPTWDGALSNTIDAWSHNPRRKEGDKEPVRPSGLWERRCRSVQTGVLLLYVLDPAEYVGNDDETPFVGFAASFPFSNDARPIDYQVNIVSLQSEFGWTDDDFDDDDLEG